MNKYVVEVFAGEQVISKDYFSDVAAMKNHCKVNWEAGFKFVVSQIVPVEFSWVEEWEGQK